MNRYPLWKYVLVIAIFVISTVYALPNIYPQDPVVQVSSGSARVNVDETFKQTVESVLTAKNINFTRSEVKPNYLEVAFADDATQSLAFEELSAKLDKDDYIKALNRVAQLPGWLKALNARPMNLGLDLRGGVYFLLEVDMDTALNDSLNNFSDDFQRRLKEKNINWDNVSKAGDTLVVKFKSAENKEAGLSHLRRQYRDELQFAESEENSVIASYRPEALLERQSAALQQNIISLRKRVNELGVSEPVIQQQGNNRIVVQLPGVQDTARAKEIIGKTATLEFRMVDQQGDAITAGRTGRAPVGTVLRYNRDRTPVLVNRRVILTGEYIIDASSGFDSESGSPNVSIRLDSKGGSLFAEATARNVGKPMAVILIEDGDAEVINIATIQSVLGSNFQINGLDSPAEAADLALLLRAGALAAPMKFVEERTIGPSLGKENIERGFKSVVFGLLAVVIFILFYYRVFGFAANIALAMNLLIIFAVLSVLQATLTLPGIAGIVLTVGMAVDANVLIFERIREEIARGSSAQVCINEGYAKALSTIADANITTFIAAIVLFAFGTGPIKGFAVTLSIGILSSMFTAIVVSRAIINLIYGGKIKDAKKLSI